METSASTQSPEGVRLPAMRTRTIGIRVTEPEYLALENEARKTGRKVADWARDRILGGTAVHSGGNLHDHLFTELIGVELLLMNALGPLLRGERLTQEDLEALWKQVQTCKGRKARELLIKRTSGEEKRS
jgi:hypothetical protein